MNTRKEEDGEDEIIEFDEFLKSRSITARGTLDEKLSCKSFIVLRENLGYLYHLSFKI